MVLQRMKEKEFAFDKVAAISGTGQVYGVGIVIPYLCRSLTFSNMAVCIGRKVLLRCFSFFHPTILYFHN
jgi:hypothetical protein